MSRTAEQAEAMLEPMQKSLNECMVSSPDSARRMKLKCTGPSARHIISTQWSAREGGVGRPAECPAPRIFGKESRINEIVSYCRHILGERMLTV